MRATAACLVAAAIALGGCQTSGKVQVSADPPRPVEQVNQMVVSLSPPTPMNWDNRPGPDGLQVEVYLFRDNQPLPVTVQGTLIFMLYPGRAEGEAFNQAKPLRVWTFRAADLEACLARGIVGWGYGMRLPWGDAPDAPSLTLLARYQGVTGPPVHCVPIYVAMGTK